MQTMHLTDELIHQVVDTICGSMLGVTTEPIDVDTVESEPELVTLTGSIQISGDWQGDIRLHCDRELANGLASAMFGVEVDDLDGEEVRDALGEITNMTGGSIKALLPGSCVLSLPTVVEGADHQVVVGGTKLVTEAAFSCEGRPLTVAVFEAAA